MRILFISTMAGNPWGGSEELWVKSAQYAISSGHNVIFSVYNWGTLVPKLKELKAAGGRLHLRKKGPKGNGILQRGMRKLVSIAFSGYDIRKLKKFKPQVIFISQGTVYECMVMSVLELVKSTQSRLFIITQANTEYNMIPAHMFKLGREIFPLAEKLYFVSERNKRVAERQLALKMPNSAVISNPANLTNYEASAWPVSKEINFACVGRLDAMVKGGGVLLEILGQPQWRDRKWKLHFFGKGKDELYLKELVVLYELEDKVSFKGYVSSINDIWRHHHLLLMPSTSEGTPLALIEAMICARPAVVSDVGGNAELIIDGQSGFVAEAPSTNSFGKAMEKMWNQKENLASLGVAARQTILSKVDLESYKKIIDIL